MMSMINLVDNMKMTFSNKDMCKITKYYVYVFVEDETSWFIR